MYYIHKPASPRGEDYPLAVGQVIGSFQPITKEKWQNNISSLSQTPSRSNCALARSRKLSGGGHSKLVRWEHQTFLIFGSFHQGKEHKKTKCFIGGNYEIELDAEGHQRKLHYLSASTGLSAGSCLPTLKASNHKNEGEALV